MKSEKKRIYNFGENDFSQFEYICLENKGLGFPELEQTMYNYILSQPKQSVEFKNCQIHHETLSGEEVREEETSIRTVQMLFHDHNLNKLVRLWGSRSLVNDKVLAMTIDFLNVETHELEKECVMDIASK